MKHGTTLFDEHQKCITKIQQQKRLISQYHLPLVIISTHAPKEMAQSKQSEQLFNITFDVAVEALKQRDCCIVDHEYIDGKAGKECTLVIKGMSASELKHMMIKIESHHTIGRVMNLDVIDGDGKTISRSASQLEPRTCLVCQRAACYCATNHRHSQHDIEEKITQLLDSCLYANA
jgi:holo-ACP synthase